jgi:purine-nucleoside phosphorylase
MNSYGLGAEVLAKKLKSLQVGMPAFHVVLGSGFKDSLNGGIPERYRIKGEIAFREIEGLHASTAPGHAGKYVILEHAPTGKVGLLQVGRLHGYEGLEPREVVQTVMISRELGATDYFITNAAGGIDPAHRTGDVMVITDQINLSGKSPLTGLNPRKADGTEWGPRFQDLTRLFDREWNGLLRPALQEEGLRVHQGVYIGVPGPAFETPAEIRFFATAGAQAVGMSTVWETIALKHSGARVSGISLISNLAAGLQGGPNGEPEELDHFAILDACKSSSIGILKAILASVERAQR